MAQMYQLRSSLTSDDNRGGWSRSPGVRALLIAALMVSLVLGGAFLLVGRLHSSPGDVLDHPVHPLTDEQAEGQVVETAKQIVTIAGLQRPTAGYLLMSCKNRDDPPYQGAVYMDFAVPAEARADMYFRSIAGAMIAQGWNEGLPPNQAYGRTLYKGGVTAIFYMNRDVANFGIMRLYGQCRNMNNHRNDTTAWVDITDKLDQTG